MMQPSWFSLDLAPEQDLERSGIYLRVIGGVPSYVGKATPLRGRLRNYQDNIQKMVERRPYRPSNPEGFRRIHRALFDARSAGVPVTFKVLETCAAGEALLRRERHWIAALRPPLNGRERREQGDRP